jgi:transcriptional regulator with XRE-family HTH domain
MTELQLRLINLVRNGLSDAGMTQSELAVAIGISDKHMAQMLCGHATGSIRVWNNMLRYLKIPVTELV